MSTTRDPLSARSSNVEPGLGWPAKAAAGVFAVGLVVIGLLYMAGEPVNHVDADSAMARGVQTQPEGSHAVPAAQPGKPYRTPSGLSPLPKPGEGIAAPMPPQRLATEQVYEADAPEVSDLPVPDEPVPWTQAHKYIGQTITVKGTIVDTGKGGQICFLNYDPDWQDKFYIAMFPEAYALLPDPPEEHYLNKTLLVTGKVSLHRDRPQIQVRDVSQIEVVE
jgi:hypothetical protein